MRRTLPKSGNISGEHVTGHRITGDRTGQSSGRGIGWEYLHVAVDDRSRLAFTQLLPSERKQDASAFLESGLAWFASLGVTVERVMTDNGSAYKSRDFAATCARNNVIHKRTRPYSPKTNGKAERFIQSSIREWAYARPFTSSADRHAAVAALAARLQHSKATRRSKRKTSHLTHQQGQPPWQ